MKYIYLDNAATTKMDEEVLKDMLPYLKENYGNPSSVHKLGQKNKIAIENARNDVAKILNAEANEIIFTSGGSESDNMAIFGVVNALKEKGNHIITSKIEHPAILNTCKELEQQGFKVTYLDVDSDGFINIKDIEEAINPSTILVSVMFANNEIGTIEPIKEIGQITRKNGIIFHTDAVQAIGNVKIDVKELNIDMLSLSAHKFYGPKGIGALYIRKGIVLNKFINGGHQERDRRAGTENVAGIVGLAKAITIANRDLDEHINYITGIRDYLISEVMTKIKSVKLNGSIKERLPGNINFSFEGCSGESIMLNLDMKDIFISTGSACASGSIEPSKVLMAIGLNEKLAKSSIRISIGKNNTKSEIDVLVNNLVEIVERLRKIGDYYGK